MFDCFHKMMCTLGHHHFITEARWCSPKKSITIEEYKCTHCGELAFKLITFNPETCESLTRYARLGTDTCEDYGLIVGVGRDRRVAVEENVEEKKSEKRKPRSTTKTKTQSQVSA